MPPKKQEKVDKKKSNPNDEMFKDSVNVSEKGMKKLSPLIDQYIELEGELEALKEAVTNANEKLRKLRDETIPQAMTEAGTGGFTDARTGRAIELNHYVSAKWPKEDQAKLKKAMAWLKEVKALDLLKAHLEAAFGQRESAQADKFAAMIKKAGIATVTVEKAVHNKTLVAFIKTRLKDGKKVPLDVFEAYTGTRATLVEPKK